VPAVVCSKSAWHRRHC